MRTNETQTLDPPTEAAGTATVAPAGPVPQAGRPMAPPAAPIALPTGDPAAGALALLAACAPDAPSILRGRIDRITAELDDQVEEWRLDLKLTLPDFVSGAGRRVKLRAALRARAGRLSAASPAAEVLELVRSVRRWRPAEELKAARARAVAAISAELGRVEARLAALCGGFRGGADLTIDVNGPRQKAGLVHQHDEFLGRAEEMLKQREALRGRLARLDASGDDGRAASVRQAVEQAGGVDALVDALAPSMHAPAADELAAVRRAKEKVAADLEAVDPETRRAADMAARRDELGARLPELAALAARQGTAAARALVADALTGRLGAVSALEATARGRVPELAAALNRTRADDAALVATIAEMIGQA